MIGNKLHNLLNELSANQNKALIYRCGLSSDKRMAILKVYLQENQDNSLENLNDFLAKEVKKTWPNSDDAEQDLKARRLSSFYCEQIEKLILETYLEKNNSVRNLLLAEALEKKGNLVLLNQYYEKAYRKSVEERNDYYQMLSLKGRIRMHYASQNEKEFEQALQLNEELLKVLRHANNDKITEYYYNLSNIYIEKNSLIKERKEAIEQEIFALLDTIDYPYNKVSLYVSLAKINFDNDQLFNYFEKAKSILYSIEKRTNEYDDLERKIRFLELRLNFFSGLELEQLLKITDEIIKDSTVFSIINNNTLFYKILFLILSDKITLAEQILDENTSYFKGNSRFLISFLKALIAEKNGDYKKALHLFQPIMYTTNYFTAIFSRLLVIKIHTKMGNQVLAKSLIESTSRMLKLNSDNPIGKQANEYVIRYFKRSKKTSLEENVPSMTVLHRHIIS